LTCRNEQELRGFIADLLSPPEIQRAVLRWDIAQTCIELGCSQRQAEKRHQASQDLVKRVFEAVRRKGSGYRLAYARLRQSEPPHKTEIRQRH
jgi:uncharacterized protein YerC